MGYIVEQRGHHAHVLDREHGVEHLALLPVMSTCERELA